MKSKLLVTTLALAASLNIGTNALANTATSTIEQTIIRKTKNLSVSPTSTFSPPTLNGQTLTTSADLGGMVVTDATGTGEKWRVSVAATQLTQVEPAEGFVDGTTAATLPLGSLEMSSANASISNNQGTTAPPPTFNESEWVIDNGTPVTLLKAEEDQGMGKYNVEFGTDSLTLTLNPSDTYVDTVNYPGTATPYKTEVTYAITSAP